MGLDGGLNSRIFNKRLYAEIDGFNMCMLLEFIERLSAGNDGFNVCVLLEFIERLYAGIDGFNVCVLLELSDSLCAGIVTTCVVCVHAKIWVGQRICDSLLKLSLLQRISFCCRMGCSAANCDSLPKLSCPQRISIHCRNVCSAVNLRFAIKVELSTAN